MKRQFVFMLAVCMLFSLLPIPHWEGEVDAATTTYYVDSLNGNDANDGTSSSTAWQSLSRVNNGPLNTGDSFQPGDRILFKAGGIWNGQLKPKGSGTDGSPIVIGMYGEGSKPLINGNGLIGGTVELYNQEYIEITNLEITNDTTDSSNARSGINIVIDNFGEANHIYIRDNYIHNVKGWAGTGGIRVYAEENTNPSWYDDVKIENNTIRTVDKEGISVYSEYRDEYFTLNLEVRGNYLEDIGGNGIVPINSSQALVEYNVVHKGSSRPFGVSIPLWPFASNDALFQYNEVYETIRLPDNGDAQAFDADWKSRRTIFQYNYAHDNEGGFIATFNDGGNDPNYNIDNIFRYNISQNDGEVSGYLIKFAGPSDNTLIHNNTIYNIRTVDALYDEYWGGNATNVKLYNNIFHSTGHFTGWRTNDSDYTFSNNLVYNEDGTNSYPNDPNIIKLDPLLVNPGTGGSNIDFNDPGKLSGYKLQSTSPAIDEGMTIASNGGKDFWGQPLYSGTPDIGAFEYQGSGIETAPVRINSGSAISYTDALGRVYGADRLFSGGQSNTLTEEIGNTTDDSLFQSYRYGSNFSYDINMANGDYTVYLKFIEPYFTSSGSRVFDVLAENSVKVDDLDVYAAVGQNSAHERSFTVTVNDGQLNLDFVASTNNAIISGIAILEN